MTTPNDKYAAMSQEYMARAEDYLMQGDLKQASEKSWGAAACALKSIAEQRVWQHQSHSLLHDIANQVVDELRRPDLRDMFVTPNPCTRISMKTGSRKKGWSMPSAG